MPNTTKNLKSQFLLNPNIIYLNFGSFGSCPKPIFENYQKWQQSLKQSSYSVNTVSNQIKLKRENVIRKPMKIIILYLAIMTTLPLAAQRKIIPTDTLRIYGKIKKEKIFTLHQLDSLPKTIINDQIIYNHKGEIKDTIKNIQGVLLKTILNQTEYQYEKLKNLNEFYFVFIASDGYKVVFSWNEIYNTETGNNFYIITYMDGKKLMNMAQRILFISTADLKTGRRYIKGLERIEVKQID